VIDSRDVFREHVPGVKRDLPVYIVIKWSTFTK